MPELYPHVRCQACGKAHDLYDADPADRMPGARYAFTCPRTKKVVTTRVGQSVQVAQLPEKAVPATWLSD
jgi:hypothetical protein